MAGLTLDTGALIAVERGERGVFAWLDAAERRGELPTVPASTVTEAWRGGRQARLARLLAAAVIEPVDPGLARAAGTLLAVTRTTDPVDAQVAQSAARRGDTILTSDPSDLQRLGDQLPGVRIRAL